MSQRIALCVQYDGSPFCGWQRQDGKPTVQASLEQAINNLDPLPGELEPTGRSFAAGRTDAGVHAAGQVVHFDCHGPIPADRWAAALNGRLPASIRVSAAVVVDTPWHACFSASYRRYRYTILNSRRPNLFLAPFSWHRYQWQLEAEPMARALNELVGTHDFAAFQKAGSSRSHSRTTVEEVDLQREGDILSIEIQATGFLYGMVRLLMGQLVAVGEGRLSEACFRKRWQECQRQEVKEAAPPQGLCLLRVGYPQPIFPLAAWYDCLPRYRLETSVPPPVARLNSSSLSTRSCIAGQTP